MVHDTGNSKFTKNTKVTQYYPNQINRKKS